MAKMNPKSSSDSYKNQQAQNEDPVSGVYDVVNVKLQRQIVGAKKTPKLRVHAHVLAVVDAADAEGAKKIVGKSFPFDLWMRVLNDDGTLNFNGKRLNHLAIANGCGDEFDPDEDADMVKTVTGVPYRITIVVEKKPDSKYAQVDAVEFRHLSTDARGKYTKLPDFAKVIGKPEARMLEQKDFSGGGHGSRKPAAQEEVAQEQDAFADDDLPF